MKAAGSVKLPSDKDLTSAIDSLKHAVQAWLDSDAEAPFVYDSTWGGLVNCGCRYVGKGEHGYCNNTFPDCPALVDVNQDFGNGTHEQFWNGAGGWGGGGDIPVLKHLFSL
jgi:hypothetical protein